jgi:putative Mn2+ efflux pump MntP
MSSKIIGFVLLALLGLFYLAQSTQSATRNYTIQNLEDKKKELETAKDEMTVEAMRLKSLNSIQEKSKELNLEPE